jgi:hypothetical protein
MRTNSFSEKNITFFSRVQYHDIFTIPVFLGIILLIGHYGLLLGETFFVNTDTIAALMQAERNAQTNGWRPDVGLGQSFLVGDLGAQHAWGFFRIWQEMFDDARIGYQVQVFFLIWVACIVLYFFLRRSIPNLGKMNSIFLCSVIAYGSLRYEYLFNGGHAIEITGTCLAALILSDLFKQPKIRHYFYYTATMFVVAFFGGVNATVHVIIFTGIFGVGTAAYKRWGIASKELRIALARYFILNIAAGLSLVILGAWIFYSIFLELGAVEYSRDPDYSTSYFYLWPGIIKAVGHVFSYFHAGFFSGPYNYFGLGLTGFSGGSNFSPLFTVVLLFSFFYKSRSFWEFISKFIVIAIFMYQEISFWFPGVFALFSKAMIFYPPDHLSQPLQVFEVLLTGFLILNLKNQTKNLQGWSINLGKITAGLLASVYIVLSIIVLVIFMIPNLALKVIDKVFLIVEFGSMKEMIYKIVVENVRLFHELLGWPSVIFYVTTAIILIILTGRKWRTFLTLKGGLIFFIVLLVNNIMLSWAVHPLSKKSLEWDTLEVDGRPIKEFFSPTDRLVRVVLPKCRGRLDYYECINKKFFNKEFGPKREILGDWFSPALNLSTHKSITPKSVADFITSFMRLEGKYEPGIIRSITAGLPIYDSHIYDLAAVNYIYSENQIPPTAHLELISKSKQFYLYRNHKAWPYYYFAERIQTINTFKDLYNAEPSVAYLWEKDNIALPQKFLNRVKTLELKKFDYGNVELKYASTEQEFLVIADSWHPNWHASVNGENIPIVKTNGIFKGVLLPPGEGIVRFFFDISPYFPGIWISVSAWSFFLFGWRWCSLRMREQY